MTLPTDAIRTKGKRGVPRKQRHRRLGRKQTKHRARSIPKENRTSKQNYTKRRGGMIAQKVKEAAKEAAQAAKEVTQVTARDVLGGLEAARHGIKVVADAAKEGPKAAAKAFKKETEQAVRSAAFSTLSLEHQMRLVGNRAPTGATSEEGNKKVLADWNVEKSAISKEWKIFCLMRAYKFLIKEHYICTVSQLSTVPAANIDKIVEEVDKYRYSDSFYKTYTDAERSKVMNFPNDAREKFMATRQEGKAGQSQAGLGASDGVL